VIVKSKRGDSGRGVRNEIVTLASKVTKFLGGMEWASYIKCSVDYILTYEEVL